MSKPHNQIFTKPYPLVDRLADQFVFVITSFVKITLVSVIIISIAYILWVSWAFTDKLREYVDNVALSVLIYLIVVASLIAFGRLVVKYWSTFILGGPAFGKLGGLPLHTMTTTMRARAQIAIELKEEKDQPKVRMFNIINTRILHDTLEEKYKQLNQSGIDEGESSRRNWAEIWDREVLETKFGEHNLREAADVNKLGFSYTITALVRSTYVTPALSNIFWVVIVLLIYLYANNRLELLTAVQVSLTLAFVFTAFWYIFVLRTLSVSPISFSGLSIPKRTRKEFSADIETLEGTQIRTITKAKPKFYEILRDYQFRVLVANLTIDMVALLLLLGAVFGVIILIDGDYVNSVRRYHALIAYGILLGGIGFAGSFYIFAVVLQNFRAIIAALITAVLSVGLSSLIVYLLSGQLDISGLRNAVFAGSGALTVALVTAVTSHVKKSLS